MSLHLSKVVKFTIKMKHSLFIYLFIYFKYLVQKKVFLRNDSYIQYQKLNITFRTSFFQKVETKTNLKNKITSSQNKRLVYFILLTGSKNLSKV